MLHSPLILVAAAWCDSLSIARGERIDDELWVRPVEVVRRFLARTQGAHVCEVPVVDARNFTTSDLRALKEPTLLTGLTNNSAWLRPDPLHWGKETSLNRYGDYRVRVNNARYDPERGDVMISVREYIESAALSNLSLVAIGYETNLESELLWGPEADIPRALDDFDYRPVLQLASALASGTQLHSHYKTWLALLQGHKAWWIASQAQPPPNAVEKESQLHTAHPCSWLASAAPEGLSFCVQRPGAVMFVGERMLHATCNLDEFVFAIGAQGYLPKEWSAIDRAFHRGQNTKIKASSKADLLGLREKGTSGFASGATPLYMMAEKGFSDLAGYLIQQRANVRERCHIEDSAIGAPQKSYVVRRPLHVAAVKGHMDVTRILVESSAEVNVKSSDGVTPLHHATVGGDLELSVYLLEKRAKVGAADSKKRQALHWAAYHGHATIAELLLKKRSKVDARTHDGTRPVQYAVSGGHKDLLTILHGAGASFDDHTLLHTSCTEGHRSVTRFLLAQGFAVDWPDQQGNWPIHSAVTGGHSSITEILLYSRAKVHTNAGSDPLLLFATQNSHAPLVDLLLQHRADIEAADAEGSRPLHVAAVSGHLYMTHLLIGRRAEARAPDQVGQHPLTWAAMAGHDAIAKLLLKSKGQVNAQSSSGHRALTSAAQNGYLAVAKLLVSKGATVSKQDVQDAMQYNHADVVKYLQSVLKPGHRREL